MSRTINKALAASSGSPLQTRISVEREQIQHAAKNNVLILRTLDLLNLASLSLSGTLRPEDVIELLTKSSGWLRVGDTAEVLTS
jgi:hypothetical protein